MIRFLLLVGLLIITSLACNIPVNIIVEDQNQKPTAKIVIVTATPIDETSTPSLSIEQRPQADITQTASSQAYQPTITPIAQQTKESSSASSKITVSVSQNTNCRSGPGVQFNSVGQLLISETAEVVGKNTPTYNWIINKPNGTGTCWLWGNYASIKGDINQLVEITPPPTPTSPPTSTPTSPPSTIVPMVPAPVSNLQGYGSCDNPDGSGHVHTVSGKITWQDNATNEQGFYIRIHGYGLGTSFSPIATLPPNTTSYNFSAGTLDNAFAMVVESYNAAGSSQRVEVEIPYDCHP